MDEKVFGDLVDLISEAIKNGDFSVLELNWKEVGGKVVPTLSIVK